MNHAGATALAVLDGHWPARPAGTITSAELFRAVAAGQNLDDIRIRDLKTKPPERSRGAASPAPGVWRFRRQDDGNAIRVPCGGSAPPAPLRP
jgi:hypothetical protein